MASMDVMSHEAHSRRRRSEGREYMAVVCLAFPVFLLAAAFARLAPSSGDTGQRRSILSEARSNTAAALAFVFR